MRFEPGTFLMWKETVESFKQFKMKTLRKLRATYSCCANAKTK